MMFHGADTLFELPAITSPAPSPMPDPTAGERWSTFGPYYAMFPVDFARDVMNRHTRPGDVVVDPFAGRGTTVFCAAEAGRNGVGTEITTLGWIYGSVKLAPAEERDVADRIDAIATASTARRWVNAAHRMPEFFHVCFHRPVLRFLLAARAMLDWRADPVDRTTMAFILVHLHGRIDGTRPAALSNQMRQVKAMAPDYSVAWWRANGFSTPPRIDPAAFLKERMRWRYAKGKPSSASSRILLGDCRTALPEAGVTGARLLLTSPPYCGVTSYYYDQWLRFWMLGESSHPTRKGADWKKRYENQAAYRRLLHEAFSAAAPLLAPDATVYVRTDARALTLDITRDVLAEVFPAKQMEERPAPFGRPTQTHLFGDRTQKPGEMDLILTG